MGKKIKENAKNSKITEKMVFASIYNWELIETESQCAETPVPCGAKHESTGNGARVQRRKNTKKINVLVSQPNYNKFLKCETNVANLGKLNSSKKQRQTDKTVNQPRSHKYQHR